MNKKLKSIVSCLVFAAFIFGFSAACYIKGDAEYSLSERRPLAGAPALSTQSVLSGEYMAGFEEYTTDQFPLREQFRFVKSAFSLFGLGKNDNNGLFVAGKHISKLDDKLNPQMLDYAADKFKSIYDKFIDGKGASVYFSIVPDKNFILAPLTGYSPLDYDKLVADMRAKTGYMEYIDITDRLILDDYYNTDTHWRQEKITGIAEKIGAAMGTDVKAEYKENTLDNPFYGVYHGQLALPVAADTIKYLTNEALDKATVTYYNDMGMPETGDMYNMKKAYSKDPYEMFLSGVAPVITIENPDASSQKELVMLRDSFGSSLAPLMVQGYKKITVLDIRYIMSDFIGGFADFENADVLFIYSTTLLNNSTAMK